MADPIDPSGISRMLTDAMSALTQFQGRQSGAEPPEGVGHAADGLITARTALPGRVSGLDLDPRVMRMASDRLAAEVVDAVNKALTDLQSKIAPAGGAADLGALSEKLREIQQDSSRQLSAFTSSLVEAQERLARRGGT